MLTSLQALRPIRLNSFDEAAIALDALGYSQAEISEALAQAPPNSTTEQLIKFALRRLNQFA